MLFSSTVFLFCFLPLVSITYLIVTPQLRNYILLFFSLFFYAWGEPRYLAVMFFIIGINYLAGMLMSKNIARKAVLVAATIINLGILVFFKYTNFFAENINAFLGTHLAISKIIMPIGISFFIFQALFYTIDVYRNDVKSQSSLPKLALYISFFPQLIAGPIVKYHDVEKYINERNENLPEIITGLKRFIIGLSKKVLLANAMGEVADKIFAIGPNGIDCPTAWLGAIAYTFQIFFDFSGYSDMAIGLGHMFGFTFLENFNYPYISSSITEFWRRWHISLSSWFKQYLYIPLGGNRNGQWHTYLNLFIVFLTTGFWHGASWNFIVWGLWHGLFIIIEKQLHPRTNLFGIKAVMAHIYTILVFVVGWVFFRADTLHTAVLYMGVMFGIIRGNVMPFTFGYYVNPKTWLVLLLCVLFSIPFWQKYERLSNMNKNLKLGVENTILLLLLVLSIASTYNPFIYFRF